MYCVDAATLGRNGIACLNAAVAPARAGRAPSVLAILRALRASVSRFIGQIFLAAGEGLTNGEDAVHLVIAPQSAYASLAEDTGILSAAERETAARHRRGEDAERYRASRVLLRTALSTLMSGGIAPRDWRFEASGHGKPVLAPEQANAHFNISHTEAGLAVALSRAPVGVDIEDLSRPVDPCLYDTMLTPAERREICRKAAGSRSRHFMKLWAMKEAYAKLLGLGHTLDFAKIEVSLTKARVVRDGNFAPDVSKALSRSIRFRTFSWKPERKEQWVAIALEAPGHGRTHVRTSILPASPQL